MKKWLIAIALLAASAGHAVEVPRWITVRDTTNIRKTNQDQYIYNGRHYLCVLGHLVPLASTVDVIRGGDTIATAFSDSLAMLSDTTEALRDDIAMLVDSLANQAYPQGFSVTVAASDSYDKSKADFICDGTNDDVEIQAAIDACGTSMNNFNLRILPGLYHIAHEVQIDRHISIYAVGARFLSVTDSTVRSMLYINYNESGPRPVSIEGLDIADWYVSATEAIVLVDNIEPGSRINNMTIWHAGNNRKSLIVSATADRILFSNIYIESPEHSDSVNVWIKGDYSSFSNSTFYGENAPAIRISGNFNRFTGCHFDNYTGTGGHAIEFDAGAASNVIESSVIIGDEAVRFEQSSHHNRLSGCSITGQNGDSTYVAAENADQNTVGPNSESTGLSFHDISTGTNYYWIQSLPDTVNAHSDSLDAHRERIVDLEAVALTAAQVDTVNAVMDSLTAHLHRLEAAEDSLADHLAWLQAVNDTLESHLSRIEDLEEGDGMCLGELLDADSTYSGTTLVATAGEDLTFGEPCYFKSDGKLWLADADSAATMPAMAIALDSISADASGLFLSRGRVRVDAWNWTTGGIVYPSTTKRNMTQSAPDGAADQIQAVGVATDPNELLFTPYPILVEHQ